MTLRDVLRHLRLAPFVIGTVGGMGVLGGWWLTVHQVGRYVCSPVSSDASDCVEAPWQAVSALALTSVGIVLLIPLMWRVAVGLARTPTVANLAGFTVLWILSVSVVTWGLIFTPYHLYALVHQTFAFASSVVVAAGFVFAASWLVSAGLTAWRAEGASVFR